MLFLENTGQFPEEMQFQALGGPWAMWLAVDALWITVTEPSMPERGHDRFPDPMARQQVSGHGVSLRLSFAGAEPHPRIVPFSQQDIRVSYYFGSDPGAWRTNVPVWEGVSYEGLYPGVDLRIGSRQGQWAWWVVAKEASALDQVRLRVEGAESLGLEGDYLHLDTAAGMVALPLLTAETPAGLRIKASGEVQIEHDHALTPFSLAGPVPMSAATLPHGGVPADVRFSTLVGGSDDDQVFGLAAFDLPDRLYVAGATYSPEFRSRAGAFSTQSSVRNAFLVEFDLDRDKVRAITLFGGSADDAAHDVAVGWDENSEPVAYVTGTTNSSDFPTPGAYDDSCGSDGECDQDRYGYPMHDAFVAALDGNGQMVYATFVGGSGWDSASGIKHHQPWGESSVLYLTGSTDSTDFAGSAGLHQGDYDAFVVKLDPDGSEPDYVTLIGGSDRDAGYDIDIWKSPSTEIYSFVTGLTRSSDDFPVTANAMYQDFAGGESDAYLAMVGPQGALLHASYIGGGGDDGAYAVAVALDNEGRGGIYITGGTESDDLPTSTGAFDRELSGSADAFLFRYPATDEEERYATYLGGSRSGEAGYGVAVNSGIVYVAGGTDSDDFPVTPWGYPFYESSGDAFVVLLDPSGMQDLDLIYGTYLGSTDYEEARDVLVLESGTAYVAGHTTSRWFPVTDGSNHSGAYDAFATRFRFTMGPHSAFEPDQDGYAFENWRSAWDQAGQEIADPEMIRMWGRENVCYDDLPPDSPQPCRGVKQAFVPWYRMVREFLGSGHCEGMTATSLRFREHLDDASDYTAGAQTAHDIERDADEDNPIDSHIAFYHVLQYTDPLMRNKVQEGASTPVSQLRLLRKVLAHQWDGPPTYGDRVVLNISEILDGDFVFGHSLVPYKISGQGRGIYRIYVYDPNLPDDGGQFVEIDAISDSWAYVDGEGREWVGDASTASLGIAALSWYELQPECHFCDQAEPTHEPADGSGGPLESSAAKGQVLWNGSGNLLISDPQGRRLGIEGGRTVNEIPGAYLYVPAVSGEAPVKPTFVLPLKDTYSYALSGQTGAQAGPTTVVQFGPGYAAGADVQVVASTQDHFAIAPDGTALSFRAGKGKKVTLSLALDGSTEGYTLRVRDADIGTGEEGRLRLEKGTGSLAFDNSQTSGGDYRLEIVRSSQEGTQEFAHGAIGVRPGDTHYFDFGSWGGSSQLTLRIDAGSDGTIDESRELPNELFPQVLVDEAHDNLLSLDWQRAREIADTIPWNDDPAWFYLDALRLDVADRYLLVREPDSPLSSGALAQYQAVLVPPYRTGMTQVEVDALQQYVSGGGGLIFLEEPGFDPPNPELMDAYGIKIAPNGVFKYPYEPANGLDGELEITDFAHHPAVSGVARYHQNWGQSLWLDDRADWLATTAGTPAWRDDNGNDEYDAGEKGVFDVVGAFDTGCGRVAAVADGSFSDGPLGPWPYNADLLRALLDWVSGGQPCRGEHAAYLPLAVRNHSSCQLYSDDFGNPHSGWAELDLGDRGSGYVDGEYQIWLQDPYAALLVTPDLGLPEDYEVRVDARQASATPAQYALAFGARFVGEQYETYYFQVDPNQQQYRLSRRNLDGSYEHLTDWTFSGAIRKGGQSNHLRIVRRGTEIRPYINGAAVRTVHDANFGGGRDVGVRAYSLDNGGVDVRFDNFRVGCVP